MRSHLNINNFQITRSYYKEEIKHGGQKSSDTLEYG